MPLVIVDEPAEAIAQLVDVRVGIALGRGHLDDHLGRVCLVEVFGRRQALAIECPVAELEAQPLAQIVHRSADVAGAA